MEIKSNMNYGGKEYPITFYDIDDISALEGADQIYAVCFCNGKVAIVYNQTRGHWTLPGGTPEDGEKLINTLKRELMEEANIELIDFLPIGYQAILDSSKHHKQVRVVATGDCLSEVINDPAGDISEVKFVNLADIGQYLDWGEVGEYVFKRAGELHPKLVEKGLTDLGHRLNLESEI